MEDSRIPPLLQAFIRTVQIRRMHDSRCSNLPVTRGARCSQSKPSVVVRSIKIGAICSVSISGNRIFLNNGMTSDNSQTNTSPTNSTRMIPIPAARTVTGKDIRRWFTEGPYGLAMLALVQIRQSRCRANIVVQFCLSLQRLFQRPGLLLPNHLLAVVRDRAQHRPYSCLLLGMFLAAFGKHRADFVGLSLLY